MDWTVNSNIFQIYKIKKTTTNTMYDRLADVQSIRWLLPIGPRFIRNRSNVIYCLIDRHAHNSESSPRRASSNHTNPPMFPSLTPHKHGGGSTTVGMAVATRFDAFIVLLITDRTTATATHANLSELRLEANQVRSIAFVCLFSDSYFALALSASFTFVGISLALSLTARER